MFCRRSITLMKNRNGMCCNWTDGPTQRLRHWATNQQIVLSGLDSSGLVVWVGDRIYWITTVSSYVGSDRVVWRSKSDMGVQIHCVCACVCVYLERLHEFLLHFLLLNVTAVLWLWWVNMYPRTESLSKQRRRIGQREWDNKKMFERRERWSFASNYLKAWESCWWNICLWGNTVEARLPACCHLLFWPLN